MPIPSEFLDPHLSHNFHVEIDGISRGSFHEVTGLDSAVDVLEHREGGWNQSPRKLAGQIRRSCGSSPEGSVRSPMFEACVPDPR